MRSKLFLLLLASLFSLLTIASVAAQDDAEEIAYGDTVEGEIEDDAYEIFYSFEGEEGDIVLIEMFGDPGTYDVDPALFLLDEDEDEIASNDDFPGLFPTAIIVFQLEDTGTYYINATRAFGEEGSSEGDYVLRLSKLEPTPLEGSIEATIYSTETDENSAVPQLFLLAPEDDTTLEVTFEQEAGDEFFAGVYLGRLDPESYGGVDMVVDIDETQNVGTIRFIVELDNNEFYLLWAQTSPSLFLFDEDEMDVNFILQPQ